MTSLYKCYLWHSLFSAHLRDQNNWFGYYNRINETAFASFPKELTILREGNGWFSEKEFSSSTTDSEN